MDYEFQRQYVTGCKVGIYIGTNDIQHSGERTNKAYLY